MVDLQVVPHEAQHLIVVGSAVRKPPQIISAYLQSLAWQIKPRGVQLFFVFVDDGLEASARQMLDEFVAAHGGQVWDPSEKGIQDFSDQGGTHSWSESAMARVGAHKDAILNFARANRAEAVWLVDADLILDPMTLTSLWSVPEQIVAACYYTRWLKTPEGQPPMHAGPQVWLTNPYGLNGNGLEEWEFRKRLMDRQITQVFGQGACSLIRRGALEKGVSFAKWPANTMPGIGQGEDRHFCMRAEALHLRMVTDPWPDIFHIYHRPEDEQKIPAMLEQLARDWQLCPGISDQERCTHNCSHPRQSGGLGDLVSLELTALEPLVTHHGPMHPPMQLVRGRLGKLALQPELEQAVSEMQRGETRIVRVHFPLSYKLEAYRGQAKLIRVVLLDHKPFGFSPVIEDEVFVNDLGGFLDTTTITDEQDQLIREVHAA